MAWVDQRERMVVGVGVRALTVVVVVVVTIRRCCLGVSPLRGAGLLRYASSRCQRPSVSPLTGCHPSRNTVGPAVPAETCGGPFPCSGIAGPDSFTPRVNEARLTN